MESLPFYLRQMQLGPMGNFVYLIGDPKTKEAAVVDPAWNPAAILDQVQGDGYRITHVLLSHGHYDHINGVEATVAATDAIVCAEKNELEEFIAEGIGGLVIPRSSLKKTSTADNVRIGELEVRMIPTPGHTPGSRCMWVHPKDGGRGASLFTGDTLFVGTIGRCDFAYSNPRDLYRSLRRLKSLEDETVFYPGHDYGGKSHNILGREKKSNPFLMADSEDDFLAFLGP